MGRFILILLFGWSGIHKFMEKKTVLGIIYLFTFGLFGIGWLIDVNIAYSNMKKKKQTVQQPTEKNIPYSYRDDIEDDEDDVEDDVDPNRINFSVAGVTFDNEDGTSRQELLRTFYEKRGYSKRDISLQKYKHEGNDAVYVIAKGDIIGNVPKEHVKAIIDNFDTIRIYHFRVKMNSKGIYYSIIDLFLK